MNVKALFTEARAEFHLALLKAALSIQNGVPSNADKDNRASVAIAVGLIKRIGQEVEAVRPAGQTSGKQFEEACSAFLQRTFLELGHVRPGIWHIQRGNALTIAKFDQYQHLAALEKIAQTNTEVAVALGNDYLIKPDIVISRDPEPDESINRSNILVSEHEALRSVLRAHNSDRPILHASVSCKWTLRSDRAQNARSEGLNLVKNRKGRLPHVVVITAEPMPGRLASIAMGTGEIDCVYHFALPELEATLAELQNDDAVELVSIMIQGKRLRDISDLPLDLAV
jgi:hypothetical protein